jgi:hypothetical protein
MWGLGHIERCARNGWGRGGFMRGKLTQQWMTGEKGLYRWRGSLENGKRCIRKKASPNV